jgi:hypothetical protein
VVCIQNNGYPASLEVLKVYRALPDRDAEKHAQRRVIDESGEDYLFPRRYFVDLFLSSAARRAIAAAAR